ncbi:hypothetical protein CDV36_004714 [Fusarium kuroshium]|uniref:Uncharacterized protein n=1 Tax=Fusarium kuroshium TaxID=2010991 RepID=A0A3M2SDH6_9HYPO|nr:hypothetical protein CDV36_004714 [Fusarium kuroshium]
MTLPLQRLPLHIIAEILGQLDTIQELGPPVLSHRIFHDALHDNLHAITRRILTRQVPDGILFYSLILLKTTQIDVMDRNVVNLLISRLENIDPSPSLVHLSLAEYAFISQNQVAIKWMMQDMADELIPGINEFGLVHPETLSDNETFRMYRAFMRYQIMCNLFCHGPRRERREVTEQISNFCRASSQWVNDQLLAVYNYLERRVSFAFDHVGAHNVEWAGVPIEWDESFEQCNRIQRLLCRGLPFLCSVARSKTYDERSEVLKLKIVRSNVSVPDPPCNLISILLWCPRQAGDVAINTWTVIRRGPPVSSYTAKELEEEAYRMLTAFAYTMWDNADLSAEQLGEICTKIAGCKDYFKRYGRNWNGKDLRLAEKRKKDIYKAGGRGYWPKGGLDDFSGITHLRDRRREQLIQKWKKATENGEDEDPLDWSSQVWTETTNGNEEYVYNLFQAQPDFDFLIAHAIWFDILSCVSTGRVPRITYRQWLEESNLDMANLMGCYNWVMISIGDLAHLQAWKCKMKEQGTLSVPDLVMRSQEIETRLQDGIEKLGSITEENTKAPQAVWVSHIFALASLILSSTIVSGPWESLPEISKNVEKALDILGEWPQAISLQGLVWPLCVIGCMAEPKHQAFFESLLSNFVDECGGFGNGSTVLRIMRNCWTWQRQQGRKGMDLAFQTGVPVLLI